MTVSPRSTTLRILTTVALAVTLGGCASTPEPQIATIKGQPNETSTEAATANVDRPRERLDMTRAELDALYEPFSECVSEKSGWTPKFDGSTTSTDRPTKSELDADAAARVACAELEPLPPWEVDRKNPDARDFLQAVIECLKDRGVTYVEIDDDPSSSSLNVALGGPDNDSSSITKGLAHIDSCMIESSKQKK